MQWQRHATGNWTPVQMRRGGGGVGGGAHNFHLFIGHLVLSCLVFPTIKAAQNH